MKKLIYLIAFTLILASCDNRKERLDALKGTEQTIITADSLINSYDKLVSVERYKMPTIPGTDETNCAIVTDIVSNKKLGAIEVYYTGEYSSYSGWIDLTEIDPMINCLNYAKKAIKENKYKVNTNIIYESPCDVMICPYFDEEKWQLIVFIENHRCSFVSIDEIDSTINILTQGKQMIKDKTK